MPGVVEKVLVPKAKWRYLHRVERQLRTWYRRNNRFAPGEDIECDCGELIIKRRGDIYICYGNYWIGIGSHFITAACCEDQIRYMPEVIPAKAIKGNYVGPRRIIW